MCVIIHSVEYGHKGFVMERNVGTLDRSVRIIAGLILISLVFIGPQTPWGWLGIVPILTGFSGRCPAYMPFGIRTCPASKSD